MGIIQKYQLKYWGLAFGLALIVALVLRLFVFQSFIVSSDKMMGTLYPSDRVLVSKVAYGARLPITPLSLPLFDHVYTDKVAWSYKRMGGFSIIKQNDVIAYNNPVDFGHPMDKKQVQFSRIICLPGDTIVIDDKLVYVNNALQTEGDNVLKSYRLFCNAKKLPDAFYERYAICGGGLVSEIGIYDFPLSVKQMDSLKGDSSIRYFQELKEFKKSNSEAYFPYDAYTHWNKDFFGPIIIPFKGQVIAIDSVNYERYKVLITAYEGNLMEQKTDGVYINGVLAHEYTVQKDYCFVLDDNRDYSHDSRIWGFLPYDHIIGKAQWLWFSKTKGINKKRERSL